MEYQATEAQKGSIKEIEDTQDGELVQADGFSIESQEDLTKAREFVKHLKERIKTIKSTVGEVKDANHKAWKKAVEVEKDLLDPIDKAIKGITVKANVYLDAEEVKRLAKEERLRKEAVKETAKRLKAMHKKIGKLTDGIKGDAERKKVLSKELEGLDPDSPEAFLVTTEIASLDAKIEGAVTKAEAHQDAAEPTISFVKPSVAPVEKPKGVTSKMKRVGTVVDVLELVKAVAQGKLLPDIFEVKQSKINKLVDSGMAEIPGVKITEERATSFR